MSLSLLSGTVLAAPLTDFEKGKSAIDFGISRPDATIFYGEEPYEFSKKSNFDLGITTGLSEKFALQYKYQRTDTPVTDRPVKIAAHEFNVLYKLQSDIYTFAGVQRFFVRDADNPTRNKTFAQFGITGVVHLSDKLDGWTTAAVGNNNHSYEVGLGYALSDQADLNLFYRYKKLREVDYGYYEPSYTRTTGLGAGITVKF